MLQRTQIALALLLIGVGCLDFTHGNIQPGPAQLWGLNNRAVYEDWSGGTADIDLNNTKTGNFKFWTNGSFPNAYANGTGWTGVVTAPVTPSGALSVSADALTIAGGGVWANVNTCVWNGSSVAGATFGNGNGFYIDIVMQFDPATLVVGSQWWPAWWIAPKEFLNGSITTTNFDELDGFEAYTGNGTTLCGGNCNPILTNHYWNTSNGLNSFYSYGMQDNIPVWNFNTPHHYSMLDVPMSKNSGTGLIVRYLDNVAVFTQSYTASAGASPALSPTNPNGALSEIDTENMCLFLNAGTTGSPATFGKVQVWD